MFDSIPAREMASFITTLPMTAALESFKEPPKAPMAVLHAEAITTSFMAAPFFWKSKMAQSAAG